VKISCICFSRINPFKTKEITIIIPYKNIDRQREYDRLYAKKWRTEHREQYRKRMAEWRTRNPEKTRKYSEKYYWAHREQEILKQIKGNARRHHKLRLEALIRYGNNPPTCACCGETRLPFLTMDHMNGKGNQHRKEIKRYGSIYEWLKHANYPEGFRVLCMNCNFAIGHYGFCPHAENELPSEKQTSQQAFFNTSN
jgi:hypothetical protein